MLALGLSGARRFGTARSKPAAENWLKPLILLITQLKFFLSLESGLFFFILSLLSPPHRYVEQALSYPIDQPTAGNRAYTYHDFPPWPRKQRRAFRPRTSQLHKATVSTSDHEIRVSHRVQAPLNGTQKDTHQPVVRQLLARRSGTADGFSSGGSQRDSKVSSRPGRGRS